MEQTIVMANKFTTPSSTHPASISSWSLRVVCAFARQFTVLIWATDAKAEVLVSTRGRDFGGEVSPNGEWLAYTSDESGEFQVYSVKMIKENDGGQTPNLASMVVVVTWVEELKARLPAP